MTASDPSRRWCVEAAGLLHDTTVRAARLASAVTADWLDPDGQAWAARIDALRRDLDRAAAEADDLARRLPDTDPALAGVLAAALGTPPCATGRGSVRCPVRASTTRTVCASLELPDPPGL